MLILGIDPGSIKVGYGIIQVADGQFNKGNCEYVASGCIKVGKLDMQDRLKQIHADLIEIITKYSPHQVSIERVFVHKNAASALKLGQARGVAIAAVAASNLIVSEYSARQIKQAVVGYGNAAKDQVQQMVKTILRLNGLPSSDAADALAAALCHANTTRGY